MAAVDKAELKVLGDPLIWVKADGAEGEDAGRRPDGHRPGSSSPPKARWSSPARSRFGRSSSCPPSRASRSKSRSSPSPTRTSTTRSNASAHARAPTRWSRRRRRCRPTTCVYVDLKMTCEGTVLKEQADDPAGRPAAGRRRRDSREARRDADRGQGRRHAHRLRPDPRRLRQGRVPRQAGRRSSSRSRTSSGCKLPELNEEFFKGMGFEGEKDFREYIREDLESRLGEEVRHGHARPGLQVPAGQDLVRPARAADQSADQPGARSGTSSSCIARASRRPRSRNAWTSSRPAPRNWPPAT